MKPATREAVDFRDGGKCRRCGASLYGQMFSRHHRKPRGMGGANRKDADRLSNIVSLCGSGTTGCHGWVESNREAAREEGWLIYSGDDPRHIPMRDWRGRLFFLTDDGRVEFSDPPLF